MKPLLHLLFGLLRCCFLVGQETLALSPLNKPEDQGFYFNNYAYLLSSVRAVQVQPGVNGTEG